MTSLSTTAAPISEQASCAATGLAALAPRALQLTNIVKSFGDYVALDDVSFDLRRGEVHALLGENGAGKSTLMNVVAGLYTSDSGTVALNGSPVIIDNPSVAHRLGIGMVHQHYRLVDTFTALENIQLENGHGNYRRSMAKLRDRTTEIAERIGFGIDLDRPVGEMSISEQQRVEILKILTADARIIILDEPTAVLTDAEADRLFTAMAGLAAEGNSVVFVTHKLREALTYADRITVMRAGKMVRTVAPNDIDTTQLTSMIVGETIVERRYPSSNIGDPKIVLKGVSQAGGGDDAPISDVNFTVREGEIYGIAGVGGNGQSRLAALLTGLMRHDQGRILLAGHGALDGETPLALRELGFACIHSDRAHYGLANDLTIMENFSVSAVLAGDFGSPFKIDKRRMRASTQEAVKAFDVRGVRALHQKAGLLSGGNAQKLVLAREFSRAPSIVIAHSPCRGLDVRAAAAVHEHLHDARDRGGTVILISEDLDEILLMSDRIGVMSRGAIVAEFDAPADRNAIGKAMTGHA
ncbi:ABC transporter ATP-binding protein [Ferruginivarius sediminum]|uniref:ABC transporter ATP-binding protein n=1 Tax=Ferruginivarius sediminum TaxID=2661937 RepID=A0A369TA93_9PROT|nr:ABC transporter ATP-binding protein [Ferruginivarius sediminum]RDD62198.1 ABC transporter ATP-binding protein [Ferruginivarius sediminum]